MDTLLPKPISGPFFTVSLFGDFKFFYSGEGVPLLFDFDLLLGDSEPPAFKFGRMSAFVNGKLK